MTFTNETRMWHPMHLHGHTFQVMKADGSAGPRKDTVIVIPKQTVKIAHRRRQPRVLDVALPQHLSHGSRHDDHLQLPQLTLTGC